MAFKISPGWKIYKGQMGHLGHGDALWEPAPIHSFTRIRLGDVGYVRRGRFHLLFSAGRPLGQRQLGVDVPLTFKPLNVGPVVYSQPRLPGCLSTSSVRETGAGFGASVCPAPMLEPGINLSFELTEKQGAALVTKHHTYREDVELESIFEAYTKRHYDSWVAFAREVGHGNDISPVLVTGVDMTRDFAMMAYSNNGLSLTSEFTTSVPMVGSASASVWGTWRTEGLVHTNCGPQLCCPPSSTQITGTTPSGDRDIDSVPDEYNQCVFVRYFTMRKRALVFPTVMRASAGPHDLGPGSRDDEESSVEVQSDSDSGSDSSSDSGIVSSLWDDDSDDDRSSVTSIDSESDIVVHNATADEKDDFDIVAEYIFRNSDAESVLIHHQNIALLRELGRTNTGNTSRDTTDLSVLLSEERPPIIVDGSGVGTIGRQADPSATIRPKTPLDVTPPTSLLIPNRTGQGGKENLGTRKLGSLVDIEYPRGSLRRRQRAITSAIPNDPTYIRESIGRWRDLVQTPGAASSGSTSSSAQQGEAPALNSLGGIEDNLKILQSTLAQAAYFGTGSYADIWRPRDNSERVDLGVSRRRDSVLRPYKEAWLDCQPTEPPDRNAQFWANIFTMEIASDECLTEVQSLLSCRSKIDAAMHLRKDDAQMFINILDQVLASAHLDGGHRKQGLRLLYKICKAHIIIPASYILQQGPTRVVALYHGGFADVNDREYLERPVAIKHLKMYEADRKNISKWLRREIIGWKQLSHPNTLPLLGASVSADSHCFLIDSDWMCFENVVEFTRSYPEANRLQLLSELMSGVAYPHELGTIHRDLKGANVLVDGTGIARVTDFGLTTMADPSKIALSRSVVPSGGRLCRLAPEQLYPLPFRSSRRPTHASDFYALSMTAYEVLTGPRPFHHMPGSTFALAVLGDEGPEKPVDAESLGFSDTLWELVQSCWSESSRPTAQQLLDRLSSLHVMMDNLDPDRYLVDRPSLSTLELLMAIAREVEYTQVDVTDGNIKTMNTPNDNDGIVRARGDLGSASVPPPPAGRSGAAPVPGSTGRLQGYTPDRRVVGYDPLVRPALLRHEFVPSPVSQKTIASARYNVAGTLSNNGGLAVVGPCSLHSSEQAITYARPLESKFPDWDNLLTVMRSYVEKPRTTVGWKDLINDPDLDGTFQINKDLRLARQLLCDLTSLGDPVGSELLDTVSPQYIADLISWGAVGARTTESQLHRELASGISFPVCFKNGTDGIVCVAVDAMKSASNPHAFMGVIEQGLAAIVKTTGNKDVHVILRGGSKGANYAAKNIDFPSLQKSRPQYKPSIMIDCSHGNFLENHNNRPKRTTVDWKCLVDDPDLGGSFQVNGSPSLLLCDLTSRDVPVGSELLDTVLPQYIGDLVSRGAIERLFWGIDLHLFKLHGPRSHANNTRASDVLALCMSVQEMIPARERFSRPGIEAGRSPRVQSDYLQL